MNCRVVVEAAVPVYDVETPDEAVRIAISKTGEMLNPDLNYVEINMGERSCPHCGGGLDPAFIAADESLVALELEMKVFNVEREEHAARIARKEIGQRLENIPLEVLEIEQLEEESDDESDAATDEAESPEESTESESAGADESGRGDARQQSDPGSGSDADRRPDAPDDEVLPEFEELIDE
jgi:uncharacterized protein (UPF0212 family)